MHTNSTLTIETFNSVILEHYVADIVPISQRRSQLQRTLDLMVGKAWFLNERLGAEPTVEQAMTDVTDILRSLRKALNNAASFVSAIHIIELVS